MSYRPTPTIEDTASKLRGAGLSEQRAEVAAMRLHGWANHEVSTDLQIGSGHASKQWKKAKEAATDASDLRGLMLCPPYLSSIPQTMGQRMLEPIEEQPAVRLFRMKEISNGSDRWSYSPGAVCEMFSYGAQSYLVVFSRHSGRQSFYALNGEKGNLAEFIDIWLTGARDFVPADPHETIYSASYPGDRWFLTRYETIERPAPKAEVVQLFADPRFVLPTQSGAVRVEGGDRAARYGGQDSWQFVYDVTASEVADAVDGGQLPPEEADEIAPYQYDTHVEWIEATMTSSPE